MPFKAARLETAYRTASVPVVLLNDRNEPEEVTLNVKYRPLSLQKLEDWASAKNGDDERDTLVRQLADVVLDLDLVEDDGVTPKPVTADYLKTLDLGFLQDVRRVIEERAFPEKKEMREMMLLKAS